MEEKLNLSADFAPVSAQQWKDKIIADLKGADFDKKLVWRTPEGFKPIPFQDDSTLQELLHQQAYRKNDYTVADNIQQTAFHEVLYS